MSERQVDTSTPEHEDLHPTRRAQGRRGRRAPPWASARWPAACGGGSSSELADAERSGSAAGTPKKGGDAASWSSSAARAPTRSTHVWRSPSRTPLARCMCYEALIDIKADGTIEMLLAESMTPNADATEWIIKLKPGITWHDGKDFTRRRRDVHLQLHRQEQEERRQLPVARRPSGHEGRGQADAQGADEGAVQHLHPGAADLVPADRPGRVRPQEQAERHRARSRSRASRRSRRCSSATRTTGRARSPTWTRSSSSSLRTRRP